MALKSSVDALPVPTAVSTRAGTYHPGRLRYVPDRQADLDEAANKISHPEEGEGTDSRSQGLDSLLAIEGGCIQHSCNRGRVYVNVGGKSEEQFRDEQRFK